MQKGVDDVYNIMNKKKIYSLMAVACVVAFVFISSSFSVSAASVNTVDKASINKTVVYMITTVIAFALLIGYTVFVDKKESVFVFLFVSVFVINLGYAFGSASTTLSEALLANKISYTGAVFLPLLMLIIIMDECRYKHNKIFIGILLCISGGIFLLTMTPGYAPWYYESVELIFVNGGASLAKTYGPMHSLYLYYLVLYFGLMITVSVWAIIKRKSTTRSVPVTLLILVFCNILVWYTEQHVNFNFEFLSISYLVTELCLLIVYTMLNPYEEKLPCQNCNVLCSGTDNTQVHTVTDNFDSGFIPDMDDIISSWPQVALLTNREIEVFKEIILNKKRKDIAEELCVSENTVKKHTSNIFTKLEVSSRADIMNVLLQIK